MIRVCVRLEPQICCDVCELQWLQGHHKYVYDHVCLYVYMCMCTRITACIVSANV